MADQFSDPGVSTGINLPDLEGRLLLIKPERVEMGITTSLGLRDATVSDVHVVDGDGTVYTDVFIWPRVLQGQLRKNLGTGIFCLGRLGKGVPKPGQNAPWKLLDATDADKAQARAYLDKAPAAATAAPAAATISALSDEPPF